MNIKDNLKEESYYLEDDEDTESWSVYISTHELEQTDIVTNILTN